MSELDPYHTGNPVVDVISVVVWCVYVIVAVVVMIGSVGLLWSMRRKR